LLKLWEQYSDYSYRPLGYDGRTSMMSSFVGTSRIGGVCIPLVLFFAWSAGAQPADVVDEPKRHSVQHASDYAAKLEVLEDAWKTLEGAWQAEGSPRTKLHYDDDHLGRCETNIDYDVRLTLNEIDAATPRLSGRFSQSVKFTVVFKRGSSSPDNSEIDAQNRAGCNEASLNDKRASSRTQTTTGDYFVTATVRSGSKKTSGLATTTSTTNCAGTCNASVYGKKPTGTLAIISTNKIRWGGMIFVKSP
jgi:hypothetical protein